MKEKTEKRKVMDLILKVLAFFIILEPVWMLLPFAGFLYGSVMHIDFLSSNPYTSWLVHFIFPSHTLFPLGLILIAAGFLIFLTGAFQIYSAKLLKKGLVKTGIYSKFRHPQYVALTLFGAGIILTWGRCITFIAFFIMMWLYYFLSKKEEEKCLELFGEDYEDYCKKTYFIFPGERFISGITGKIPSFNLPKWAKITASFLIVLFLSTGSALLIQGVRQEFRDTVPFIKNTITLSNDRTVELLMVKGPVLQASPSQAMTDRFMEKSFDLLSTSSKIREALNQLDLEEGHTLLTFLTPGSTWYRGGHRDYKKATVNAFIIILQTSLPFEGNNFREFRENWKIVKLVRVEDICYDRMEKGEEPVQGKITITPHSSPKIVAKSFQNRMEERIDFFLSGL